MTCCHRPHLFAAWATGYMMQWLLMLEHYVAGAEKGFCYSRFMTEVSCLVTQTLLRLELSVPPVSLHLRSLWLVASTEQIFHFFTEHAVHGARSVGVVDGFRWWRVLQTRRTRGLSIHVHLEPKIWGLLQSRLHIVLQNCTKFNNCCWSSSKLLDVNEFKHQPLLIKYWWYILISKFNAYFY